MQQCKSDEYKRPFILAQYDKISRLKSLDRLLTNTSYFLTYSPQQSPDVKAIIDHSKLSIERSRSSKAIEKLKDPQKGKQIQRNETRNNISLWEYYQKQISLQFIKESKDNRIQQCLKLLEPTFVHQILNLNSSIPINPNLKANINFQDNNKNSALHYAVLNQNISLVQALIFKQIQIDIMNSEEKTPFMLACIHGYMDIILILQEQGAKINHSDNEGNTSLHLACRFNQKNVVIFLLKMNGIEIQLNNEQKTPEQYINDQEIKQLFYNYYQQSKSNLQNITEKRTKEKEQQIQNFLREYFKKSKKCQIKQTCSPIHNLSLELKQKYMKNERTQKQIQLQQLFINTPSTTDSMKQSKSKDDETVGPQQFKILGLLGKGSFGEVYLVQRKEKLYAMKVLHKSLIIKQNICRYAITERNVLSVSSHPFIVKLRYAFQTQDKLFMILDYCSGGDLGQVLTKQKRLPENQVKLYICEIILALEDLHKRNIIYRDLKPDNIILDSEGHALLTDFGLSKQGILDSNIGAQSFCGSVAYLAPEMLQRKGHGKAVDWYLLGVVMYELLVGLPPFYSNDRNVLFNNIQFAELQIPNFVSLEVKTLLKSLLNRNPIDRLGSGEDDYIQVKQHPYFKDINWDKVLNRELKMPKPNHKLNLISKDFKNVFDLQSFIEIEKSHVNGWTYIQTE
ncbi:unnamed protein product [Paramecium sonneborni]|uniref:Protein kinase domain protein n=1 Tax=Paramecium sonneborni TaxID=65129 RepID=A0A8S1QX87_9CILI|nr:unnamed protein product [Paramecium sonneborni]